MPPVHQWLDPQAVPRQQQALAALIPEPKSEHAAQTLDAPVAPCLVTMNDNLGVRAGPKNVTEPLQFRTEFLKVVDFAVERHPNGLVFVGERLGATREINDREPA